MANNLNRRSFLTTASVGAAAVATTMPKSALADDGAKCTILGISCSERKEKTTFKALEIALQAAKEVAADSIAVELVELAGLSLPTALVAGIPLGKNQIDDFPQIATKLSDPNLGGIIVGTPVYFANMSSLCKAFLERCGAFRKNNFALSGIVAGVLAVGGVRNGGQELTIQSVQAALMCQEMLIVGDGRPTAHFGATLWNQKDDLSEDEFGQTTARNLGQRVAKVALQQM